MMLQCGQAHGIEQVHIVMFIQRSISSCFFLWLVMVPLPFFSYYAASLCFFHSTADPLMWKLQNPNTLLRFIFKAVCVAAPAQKCKHGAEVEESQKWTFFFWLLQRCSVAEGPKCLYQLIINSEIESKYTSNTFRQLTGTSLSPVSQVVGGAQYVATRH
jgi:hypothetical protein